MIMELLALIPLHIVMILVMVVLYFHTMTIKTQIKWKTFDIGTIIYDIFVYIIGLGVIGFCIYYIYSLHN
jgi:hypothetical protein